MLTKYDRLSFLSSAINKESYGALVAVTNALDVRPHELDCVISVLGCSEGEGGNAHPLPHPHAHAHGG